MAKHSKSEQPRTGTGKAGGHGPKPPRGQVSITSAGGAILWKATAALFGKKKR